MSINNALFKINDGNVFIRFKMPVCLYYLSLNYPEASCSVSEVTGIHYGLGNQGGRSVARVQARL
jgi:hypothetical protein